MADEIENNENAFNSTTKKSMFGGIDSSPEVIKHLNL